MDAKHLMKVAQQRIEQLDRDNKELNLELGKTKKQLEAELKKIAVYEREKQVDNLLNILIDEKRYFPESMRMEKKAHLMDESTDLNAYIKMAGELVPNESGLFYTEGKSLPNNKEDDFIDNLMNKLSHGVYQ